MLKNLKKGSILSRMIFFNTINILLVVVGILIIVMFLIFNQFEKNLKSETETAIKTFANVFKNIEEDLSKKAGKYSKDRDVIMAVTNSVMKEEGYNYKEIKKEVLNNGKILYSYMYSDISGNKKYNMKRLANLLIDYITGGGKRYGINELFLTLVDAEGKCLATSILVPEQKPFEIKDNSELINKMLNIGMPFKNITTDTYYEVAATDTGLVVRGGAVLRYDKESAGAIIVSQVVEKELVNYISSQIRMKPTTNIFFLLNNKYLVGELNLEKGYEMFPEKDIEKKLKNKDYFIDDIVINGEEFIVGYYAIRDINSKIIGFMGIANAKTDLNRTKLLTVVFISGISLLIITVGIIINLFISYKIAKPLMKLQETALHIANGSYSEIFEKVNSSYEIANLSEALQNMLSKINDNIRKIRAIEDIVSIIHKEKDKDKVLFYILSIIASERGLGYKKSAYFEYDDEKKMFYGESYSSNEIVYGQEKDFETIYEENTNIIIENKNKIRNIKIECNQNNPFIETLKEKKIIYVSKSMLTESKILELGFTEIFIIPVIYETNEYGIIIVEAEEHAQETSYGEIDIINMFATNLAIYLENKRLVYESLKNEKWNTMIKMASAIVHELRTPLTSIRGFAEMLKKSYEYDKKIQKYINSIINDSKRIDSLAADLLDYADGAKNVYNLRNINLKEVIYDVISEFKNEIDINKIKLEIDISDLINIKADYDKLKKAIYNIIKNSIEGTKGIDDAIIIKSYYEGSKVILKIIDKGIGISQNILNDIFEPLVTTKIQGTGLGLTVTKEILDAHGYRIDIKSKENVGTEVIITI